MPLWAWLLIGVFGMYWIGKFLIWLILWATGNRSWMKGK